jgi:hypothetical protein
MKAIHIFDHISLNYSWNEKFFTKKICRENQNKFYGQSFFFFEDRAVYEVMWKYTVNPGRPQMTIRRMRLHAGYKWIQTHTRNMYYLLLLQCKNRCSKSTKCCFRPTLSALFIPFSILMAKSEAKNE